MSGEAGFRCERCGAPLDVSPETIIAICPYCGYPNHISGTIDVGDIWIIPSKTQAEILRAFQDRVRRDIDMRMIAKDLEIFDVEGYYAPYWVGRIPVKGYVEYYRWETETRGKQTVRRKKHYRGHFDKTLVVPLSARRQVAEFGVKEAVKHFLSTEPKARRLADLSREEWEKIKITILNTELDRSEAEKIVREDACDHMRNYYASTADGIEFFNCDSGEPEQLRLILLPLWTVYYKYKNAVYRVVFTGWDARDVAATEPVTLIRKAAYLAGAAAGPFIAAAGFMSHSVNTIIGALIVGVILSYGSAQALLRGARVERGG